MRITRLSAVMLFVAAVPTYSLNHHYIQEGDVMWDPMMEFLFTTAGKV